MCMLPIKAGARYPTVTQAMAHNSQTLAQDCDYVLRYIPTHAASKPFADEHTRRVRLARAHFQAAYKLLLNCWHDAMCAECAQPPELTSMYDIPDPQDAHNHEQQPTLADIARAFSADLEHTQQHLAGQPHTHPHMYGPDEVWPVDDPNAAPGY